MGGWKDQWPEQPSCSKHSETLHARGTCQKLRERNPVNTTMTKWREKKKMNQRNQVQRWCWAECEPGHAGWIFLDGSCWFFTGRGWWRLRQSQLLAAVISDSLKVRFVSVFIVLSVCPDETAFISILNQAFHQAEKPDGPVFIKLFKAAQFKLAKHSQWYMFAPTFRPGSKNILVTVFI